MTRVSIVILNWNRKEETIECLKSLGELRIRNYELEIVVVDNGSTDGSVEAIRKGVTGITPLRQVVDAPKLWRRRGFAGRASTTSIIGKLIENKKNLGFAGGNNVGIKYALENGTDFVMILNNDTVVDKGLIVSFIEAAEKNKDAGIFSPKIYFAPGFEFHKDRYLKKDLGKVLWYAGGIINWDNVLGSNKGVDEIDNGQYDKIEETDFVTGACMLIKREVLEKVGLFDEKYFMYLEDADLSVRVKMGGWNVLYVPDAVLWHKVAQSSGIGSGLNDYYITRNRLLFGLRYAPLRAKFAIFREGLRLLLFGRKWQKYGVLDFYLGRFGKGGFTSIV